MKISMKAYVDQMTANKIQADEITTLRAQVELLTRRLNWIRINPNDAVALRFALKATDKEIDDVKHLITERDE